MCFVLIVRTLRHEERIRTLADVRKAFVQRSQPSRCESLAAVSRQLADSADCMGAANLEPDMCKQFLHQHRVRVVAGISCSFSARISDLKLTIVSENPADAKTRLGRAGKQAAHGVIGPAVRS